tara:strand:- start:379 stop:522 length:144 start_codon:yes stop_codon:yes gene_type:complete
MSALPAKQNVNQKKSQTAIDQKTKIELLKKMQDVQKQLKKCACKSGR